MKRTLTTLAALLVLAGCGGDEREEAADMPREDIMAVVDANAPRLIAIDGVEAVAVGALESGEPCVRIYVRALTDSLRAQLPETLGGHPVDVEVSGEFRPLGD